MASKLNKALWLWGGVLAAGLLPSAAAAAHLDLNGTWTGKASVQGQDVGQGSGAAACRDGTLEVVIEAHEMRGSVNLDGTYYLVQGKVDEDGSVSGFVGDDPLSGRFANGQFNGTATVMQMDCRRQVELSKLQQQ